MGGMMEYALTPILTDKPHIINLMGGPGSGKSRTASGLHNALRHIGCSCELVTELAKDMSYEKRWRALGDQLYIMAAQEFRHYRLIGEVDIIITDSPVFLGTAYAKNAEEGRVLVEMAKYYRRRYHNHDVFILRPDDKPFETRGRHHDEQAAKALDGRIFFSWLDATPAEDRIAASFIKGDASAVEEIIERVIKPFCKRSPA